MKKAVGCEGDERLWKCKRKGSVEGIVGCEGNGKWWKFERKGSVVIRHVVGKKEL